MVELASHGIASIVRPGEDLEEAPPTDFWAIWRYLMSKKWVIVAATLLFGCVGVGYAFLTPPWFRSEVVMTPVAQKPALAGLGQIGGLASLAGIELGGGGSGEYMATLRSRGFAADFIASKNLIPVLFADEWDSARGAWKSKDVEKQPDIRKAVEYFDEKVRTIAEDKKAATVTIGIQWKDPSLAAEWANDLSTSINAKLRKSALDEAERNVRYLQQEIATSNVVSMQQSIGRVLESEMQKLMMARGSEEFAFKIVDRAVPARKRYRPQRVLLIVMATMAGALVSIAFLLAQRALIISSPRRMERR
jgi:uncharacterized protein involved in exopolysaccharide biosynthesis